MAQRTRKRKRIEWIWNGKSKRAWTRQPPSASHINTIKRLPPWIPPLANQRRTTVANARAINALPTQPKVMRVSNQSLCSCADQFVSRGNPVELRDALEGARARAENRVIRGHGTGGVIILLPVLKTLVETVAIRGFSAFHPREKPRASAPAKKRARTPNVIIRVL